MLADEVDAVIGGDTHRDSHALEMAAPNGGTIGTLAIGNGVGLPAASPGWRLRDDVLREHQDTQPRISRPRR